jgi:hypothetical protein
LIEIAVSQVEWEITATDLYYNAGRILERLPLLKAYIITKNGKPVGMLTHIPQAKGEDDA